MTYDVVIIGGGPAGLALAHWLKTAGKSYVVIEQGAVGETWRRMPAGTMLLSPWWTNVLPGTRVELAKVWHKVSSLDFALHLENYATRQQLNVVQHTKVLRVRTAPGAAGFEIETDKGLRRGKLVVCASGYYQNPYIPVLPEGNDGSVPALHASEYIDPRQLLEVTGGGRNVLIVGKRITAGQMMHDLHQEGFAVSLSARSPVATRARWRMYPWKERLYFLYEAAFVRLFPTVKAKSRPIMDGGEKADLLQGGAVRQLGAVRGVRAGKVSLADGTSAEFSAVIFATGYRPALSYLPPQVALGQKVGLPVLLGMESREVPGLFFLGLENLRSFLSPYLRGIYSDARVLARNLCRRLEGEN
jgi:putative flavoprotein involved in K+ transport